MHALSPKLARRRPAHLAVREELRAHAHRKVAAAQEFSEVGPAFLDAWQLEVSLGNAHVRYYLLVN